MKSYRITGLIFVAISCFMFILGLAKPSVVDSFNIYWIAASAALIPGVLLLAKMPKAATYFARLVVGSIFIVSGLIKANDTVGFSIKLEEYFDPNALGAFWAVFYDYSLPIAIFIAGVETLLGLAVIFGAKSRLVTIVLLIMTIFFAWLTYFTASCNDAQLAAMSANESFSRVCVTDCGCFGDALRGSIGRAMTPWESFYKDVGLFFLVVILLLRSGKIKLNTFRDNLIMLPISLVIISLFGGWLFGWMFPTWFFLVASLVFVLIVTFVRNKGARREWILAGVLAIMTYGFAIYTYKHLPIKDYRPYAVGDNIKDQMKTADELGLEPTVYASIYKLKNMETGEIITMNSKEYLDEEIWKDKSWDIVSTGDKPIVISRGYEPPIATFTVTDSQGRDLGQKILDNPGYSFIVVMYDISRRRSNDAADKLANLAAKAEQNDIEFFGITSSPYEVYEPYRHKNQLPFTFYTGDAVFLKTIIRSNPGLVLMKDAEIIAKWSASDIPDFKTIKNEYLK